MFRAGNQPMESNSKDLFLTYNGEIYNHLEIRRELETNNSKLFGKVNLIQRLC